MKLKNKTERWISVSSENLEKIVLHEINRLDATLDVNWCDVQLLFNLKKNWEIVEKFVKLLQIECTCSKSLQRDRIWGVTER